MNIVQKVESKVNKTIKQFSLVSDKERILCAVSGGKDSTAVLHILNKKFDKVQAITIDASIGSYSKKNLENVKLFCSDEDIRLHIVSLGKEFGYSLCYIRSILKSNGCNMTSCAICGVLKRYLLNRKARELNATALATGHNLDDEAQSILMNLLRGNIELLAKLGPKSGSISSRKFVPRIKPLYLVPESWVELYSRHLRFPVDYARCPCAAGSYRSKLRGLVPDERQKENVVEYFLKIMPGLKKAFSNGTIAACSICGEPSRNKVCRSCEIIKMVRNRKS